MKTLKDLPALLEPGTGHTVTPARALRAVGHYLDREAPGPDARATDIEGHAAGCIRAELEAADAARGGA